MNILLVDDEKHNLEDLKACLTALRPDDEVKAFLRGDEALKFSRNMRIDVAFLDINMPVISGIDLAKELKKNQPFVNIIFCTAYSEYMAEAIRLHASGYITKPYEAKDVERELNNLLNPIEQKKPKVFVRTFGDFDVFFNGVAITFLRAKCKELLAYLVWKKGGIANRQELVAVLFEDENEKKTQNYLVHIYGDLVKSLQKYGLEKMLIKGHNQYAVDTNFFKCDYYDYEAGNPEVINAYKGDFMAQYEWAEFG